MADEVWAWCEKSERRGRTVTVKIKWADFQQSTRSQSFASPIAGRVQLHEASLALIRSVYPLPKKVRLVGVSLSNFLPSATESPNAQDSPANLFANLDVTDSAGVRFTSPATPSPDALYCCPRQLGDGRTDEDDPAH
jgi:hypothetical protein